LTAVADPTTAGLRLAPISRMTSSAGAEWRAASRKMAALFTQPLRGATDSAMSAADPVVAGSEASPVTVSRRSVAGGMDSCPCFGGCVPLDNDDGAVEWVEKTLDNGPADTSSSPGYHERLAHWTSISLPSHTRIQVHRSTRLPGDGASLHRRIHRGLATTLLWTTTSTPVRAPSTSWPRTSVLARETTSASCAHAGVVGRVAGLDGWISWAGFSEADSSVIGMPVDLESSFVDDDVMVVPAEG
jgi:hypothetical protein